MLAVIFDMDGLMFDTERLNTRAWIESGKKHGWTLTEEFMNKTRGMNVTYTHDLMVNHFGPTFDFYAVRKDRIDWAFRWIKEHGMLIKPGLLELLTWLDDHAIKRAIASSSDRSMVDYYIDNVRDAALAQRLKKFHAIVTGEQIKRSKPEPDIFLEAARQLDIAPQDCVVLEDSYNGIKAAHAANMIPIMVPDLLPLTPEIEPLIHACLYDLTCVIPALEKLNLNS